MIPTAGSTALPAGTLVSLASGDPIPIDVLAPGAVLENGATIASVAELPLGAMPDAILLAVDAFRPQAPATPLILSPMQWIAFGDRLAPAGALANGGTILRLVASPPTWYAITADHPATLTAAGVTLPLPGPAGIATHFRPLAAGPELDALRASLRPSPPPALRLMLGTQELPVSLDTDRMEATLPATAGELMTILRLVSPAGYPRGTSDLRRFGVAIRKIELDGEELALDYPGLGEGFYAVESRDNASWRWTNGAATLVLPASESNRFLVLHLTTWHTHLEPA